MGIVVSIMNEKGGVGKSTITFSVVWELMKRGFRSLIVDMDGQKANISYLAGISVDEQTETMREVLEGCVCIRDAIKSVVSETGGSISIIPAGFNTSYLQPNVKISRMQDMIGEIKSDYDFVFFDVNPSPDWRHALTLAVLDYITVIMMPDVVSLEANSGIFDSILEVQDSFNPNLKVLGFLMNQFDGRTNLAKAVVAKTQEMAEYYHTAVLQSVIRKSVQVAESVIAHKGVTAYAPRSAVASDIRNLTEELLQNIGMKGR